MLAKLRTFALLGIDAVPVEVTFETMPSVLFDAVAVPGGKAAVVLLGNVGHAIEFIKDQYRHGKTLLVMGDSRALLKMAGIEPQLPGGGADPGIVMADSGRPEAIVAFMEATGRLIVCADVPVIH